MDLEQIKESLVGDWASIAPEIRPSAGKNPDGTLKPFYLKREFKYLAGDRFALNIVNSADPNGAVPLARIAHVEALVTERRDGKEPRRPRERSGEHGERLDAERTRHPQKATLGPVGEAFARATERTDARTQKQSEARAAVFQYRAGKAGVAVPEIERDASGRRQSVIGKNEAATR